MSLILSPKFKDFLTYACRREYLEGTTAAGKTTVGIFKFVLKVISSDTKEHLISGLDKGTIEKNIINSSNGLLELFPLISEYYPSGKGKITLPHIRIETKTEPKIIYICGYNDKTKWKKVLGSQLGCVYIDEVNVSDMEFMREISHRCTYMMTTSNPDDPSLPIYKEFINKSRPIKRYEKDYPRELLEQLSERPVKGWVHWYFTFYDNASLTPEKIREKIESVPEGTKMYKNKILGIRGRATGLVFSNIPETVFVKKEEAKKMKFTAFSIGVDTSYSSKSKDLTTVTGVGITTDRKCVLLKSKGFNNTNRQEPFSPSDVVKWIVSFAEDFKNEYGFARNIYIDSADVGTILECNKWAIKNNSLYSFKGAYKKVKNITRVQLQNSWMKTGNFFITEDCPGIKKEMDVYSYDEDGNLEDGNDHYIQGAQYAWINYIKRIGNPETTQDIII